MYRNRASLLSLVALAGLWTPAVLSQERSAELETLLSSATRARTPEALLAHSRGLEALALPYEVALPRVLAANENLYVFVIQQQLLGRQLRSAPANGILSQTSLRELLDLCAAQSIDAECGRGPMTPEVAALLGTVFDAGSERVAAISPASGLQSAASAGSATPRPNTAIEFSALLGGTPDFDGDGTPDVLLDNGAWLAYRNATGTIVNIGAANGSQPVGAGDFDGDGKDDLLLLTSAGWLSYWSQDEFVDIGAVGDGQLLAVGDIDGDGLDDALLGRGSGGWLYHVNATVKTDLGSFAGAEVIALGDQDGDGRDDLTLQTPSGWRGTRLSATGETVAPGA